jgi:hypothetical protein
MRKLTFHILALTFGLVVGVSGFLAYLYFSPAPSSSEERAPIENSSQSIGPQTFRHLRKRGAQIIYDYVYTLQKDTAFRVLPAVTAPSPESHMILLGCSFTWGQGVKDEETLHYQLHKRFPHTQIINWGIKGSGPNTTLKILDEIDVQDTPLPENGYTFYFLMSDHVGRVTGDLFHMIDMFDDPYFELTSQGDVVYRGSFQEGRPLLTSLLRWASRTEWIRKWNVNYPSVESQSSKAQFCGVLKALHQKVKEKFPTTQFYFVMYPNEYLTQGYRDDCLKPHQLPYVDAFHLIDGQPREDYFIPQDGHPNGKMNVLLADFLKETLK